jgi:hypothetical protein
MGGGRGHQGYEQQKSGRLQGGADFETVPAADVLCSHGADFP